DDRLVVDRVVLVCLVQQPVDASPDLRQDHHQDVLVLDRDRVPSTILTHLADPIVERKRIHAAARALVDPVLEEHRVPFRLSRDIGWKHQRFATYGNTHGSQSMTGYHANRTRTGTLPQCMDGRKSWTF